MQRIHKYLDKRGVPLGAAQVQYSLLSRGPQQEQIRAVCRDLGVQMIAYSPMALGMLSGKVPLLLLLMLSHCSMSCVACSYGYKWPVAAFVTDSLLFFAGRVGSIALCMCCCCSASGPALVT